MPSRAGAGQVSDRGYKVVCVGLALAILLLVRFPRFSSRGPAGLEDVILREKRKVVPVRAEIRRDVMIDFPILVLGGFRGPLVMGLWIKAEAEKNDQQWWNVKTYHEIIAHLQPNFPSVYVFNAWNLAYNLSVQWHELESKYQWALDGARYAQKGVWINPDSPDIMFQLADIYGQKLGRAMPERLFYRQRFAQDTVGVAKLVADFPPEQRLDLANSTALSERDKACLLLQEKDGKLQLGPIDLGKYPFGVSPFYFDYEYESWTVRLEPHGQIGEVPMHARPSVVLMGWARSETLTAVAWAGKMTGSPELEMAERDNPMLPAPAGEINPPPGSARWNELKSLVLFHFDESDRRFAQAIEGFKAHLQKYPDDAGTHEKHIYQCTFQRGINQGRKELFLALCLILENDGKVLPEAVPYLTAAFNEFKQTIGVPLEDGSYPPGTMLGYQLKFYPAPASGGGDPYASDRKEYKELIAELSWKNQFIIRLGEAFRAGKTVQVDMNPLKLYESEKFY